MSLDLDERQRAMLGEMGVQVFWPEAPVRPSPADAPAPALATSSAPATAKPVTPLPATVAAARRTDSQIVGTDSMDWTQLEEAVTAWSGSMQGRPVFGTGDRNADWMVIGDCPSGEEEARGEPFLGTHGKLLDNMLRSIALKRTRGVYITNVLKCRLPGNRNPEPDELAQCEPFVRREVALVKPRIILAMGRFAAQSLLQSPDAIGQLRGRVHTYGDVPLVVTYPPAYLLRNLVDKAKAWADLCLAQQVMKG